MKSEHFDLIEEYIDTHGWPIFQGNPEDGFMEHWNEARESNYAIFHTDWDMPGREEIRFDDLRADYNDCVILRYNVSGLTEEETLEVLDQFFYEIDEFFANL